MMTLTSQEVSEIAAIISRLSGTQAASANTGVTVPLPVPVSAENNASGSCDENQEASSSSKPNSLAREENGIDIIPKVTTSI